MHRLRTGQGFLLLAILGATPSCRPDPSGRSDGTALAQSWSVDSAPLRVIGEGDGVEFGEISGVGLLANGAVLVVEGATPAVWLFPADGAEPIHVGRVGAGPGEFRYPQFLNVLADDAFAIYDPGQRRVILFGGDGELRTSFPVHASAQDSAMVNPVGLLPDRQLLATLGRWPHLDKPGEVIRLTAQVVGIDSDGDTRLSFGTYGFGEWMTGTALHGTPIAGPRWFGWRLAVANSDRYVAIGETDAYEVRVFGVDGDSVGTIRELRAAQPVSAAQRERIFAMARANKASPDMTSPERFSDSLPVIRKLLIDREGLIWIVGTRPGPGATDTIAVFTHKGARIATLPLPLRFQLGAVGDSTVVGVTLDSNDVQTVMVLRLRRGAEASQ